MNKTNSKVTTVVLRPAFLCGVLLLVATFAIAQNALDANLRVGSGGYNSKRPQMTMNRSIYKVSSTGGLYYNRGAAFNSSEVYDSAIHRQGFRTAIFESTPSGNRQIGATALARPTYSAGRPARPSTNIRTIPSKKKPKANASLQRAGYSPGRALNAMQAPSLSLQQKPYSVSGSASSTIRSR